jgi:type IV secretion system protein VirB10
MTNNNLMSPDTSPSSLPKSGVRRVNNLPVIIVVGALTLFVVFIAMVAVKRANKGSRIEPDDIAQFNTKLADTRLMADEVVNGRGAGLIPSDQPAQTPVEAPIETPIAPLMNPDAPLKVPSKVDFDPDSEQIRAAKMEEFQSAVKAKTNIPFSTQIELLNTPMRSEGVNTASANDPDATYQKQLAKIRKSMGDNGYNTENSSLDNGGNQQNQSDRWKLDQNMQAPRSRFEIRAGSVIPGIMISGVNSDLPGQIIGQVSQGVYDTPTGKYLLIPQGTRLIGSYSNGVVYGQSALLVAWQRLIFPDGKALDIGEMPGADSAGYSGFRDQVNNHYFRIFASAFLMSGVTAAAAYATTPQYSQKMTNGSTNIFLGNASNPTVGSTLTQALGEQLGNVSSQMIAKNLNIAPTLEIRPGYRFNVIVVKDIAFTASYKSFDY